MFLDAYYALLFLMLVASVSAGSGASNVVLCGQYSKYNTSSSPYTFSTNQWGGDGSGSQCISVSNDATVFNTTWNWNDNPASVHAFPNINLNSNLLPLQLSSLLALNVSAAWSMDASSSVDSLESIGAAANVVIDMFLDPDPCRANSTTLPLYEVMVWIAEFGGKKPIGFSSSIKNPPTYNLNGTKFTLYSGSNKNGQFVFSWLASSNIANFNSDISPLVRYLWHYQLISASNYLGIVQFGSEAFHATSNVTFSARNFSLRVGSGQPGVDSKATVLFSSPVAWSFAVILFSIAYLST